MAAPTPDAYRVMEAECEGPEAHPWVRQRASDLLDRDGLLAFALAEFGAVVSCTGEVSQEFDRASFGTIVFEVGSGVVVTFESMPPAAWMATLSHPNGFIDEGRVLGAAGAYALELGLAVEWEGPERSWSQEVDLEQYWDPDPGVNGSVTLLRRDGVLVGFTVSLAP